MHTNMHANANLISLAQISALTGKSVYKIKSYIDDGNLDIIVVSGKYLVTINEVNRFIKDVLKDNSILPLTESKGDNDEDESDDI